jgi:predicted Rossmann fold flavoprotein
VLDALLREASSRDVALLTGRRVRHIERSAARFTVVCDDGETYTARRVVLATGGRSLPKSGSDGAGYALARALGHGYVETTPALAPLVLDGDRHRRLAGIALRVALSCGDGRERVRLEGAMLWTHFGISGPVALNVSRHWHRGALAGVAPAITMNLCPAQSTQDLHEWLQAQRDDRPRALVQTVLAALLPAAVAAEWCDLAALPPSTTMSHVTREQRVALVDALQRTPLAVRDSRGYAYAEVTAGGIPLEEVDVASMESGVCPGLFLVG